MRIVWVYIQYGLQHNTKYFFYSWLDCYELPIHMKLKLLEKLDSGGFADVWRARDDELERDVAVKIIREASLGVADALAHAKALARASHPNVVAVFDISKIQDPDTGAEADCVIMELLQGETLAGRLESKEISLSEAINIGTGIIDGLSHIHAQGMTHGDLHEENVMVVGGTSKVIDILYLNSLALLSTQKQDAKLKRDLRNLRDLLQQLVIRTELGLAGATEFINLGADATIDDMRTAFIQIPMMQQKSSSQLAIVGRPQRVFTEDSNSKLTPNCDLYDLHIVTALSVALVILAPTGTPYEGQKLSIFLTDNGTARLIAWHVAYAATSVALPFTTVVNTRLRISFMYNSSSRKWDCIGVV